MKKHIISPILGFLHCHFSQLVEMMISIRRILHILWEVIRLLLTANLNWMRIRLLGKQIVKLDSSANRQIPKTLL